MQNVTTLLDSF